jgi:hypothetical protein
MSYQPKNWRWCKHCQRNTNKNGHTPFCPATTIEEAHGITEKGQP